MKRKMMQGLCLIFFFALLSISVLAHAEVKKPVDDNRAPIVKETEFAWKRAKKWTLEYVDAMPENALNFKPTAEVRSFAEQMLHLKTKAALRKVVAESYDAVLIVVTRI